MIYVIRRVTKERVLFYDGENWGPFVKAKRYPNKIEVNVASLAVHFKAGKLLGQCEIARLTH